MIARLIAVLRLVYVLMRRWITVSISRVLMRWWIRVDAKWDGAPPWPQVRYENLSDNV